MNGDHVAVSFPQTSGSGGPYNASSTADSPPGFYYNPVQMMAQQQQQRGGGSMQPQQQDPGQQSPISVPGQSAQPLAQVPSASSLFRFGAAQMHMKFRHHNPFTGAVSSPALARALSTLSQDKNRRPRSEKKPIPDDQKDDKYFERRRRNNEAAKKSRDARKSREDELAIRASYLEKDNSVLKVQVMSMREEAMKLRQMWFQKCQSAGASNINGNGRPASLGGPPPPPQGGRTS